MSVESEAEKCTSNPLITLLGNWKSTYEGWDVINQVHSNNILISKPHTGNHQVPCPIRGPTQPTLTLINTAQSVPQFKSFANVDGKVFVMHKVQSKNVRLLSLFPRPNKTQRFSSFFNSKGLAVTVLTCMVKPCLVSTEMREMIYWSSTSPWLQKGMYPGGLHHIQPTLPCFYGHCHLQCPWLLSTPLPKSTLRWSSPGNPYTAQKGNWQWCNSSDELGLANLGILAITIC